MAGLALVLWSGAERPDALVSQTGGLIGVLTPEGRALSKVTGDGFSADSWLENDGDPVEQAEAASRAVFDVDGRMRRFKVGDIQVLHATGKIASSQALAACNDFDLVVVNVAMDRPEACTVYDLDQLRQGGALALMALPDGLKITSVRDVTGHRLWSP